MFRRLVAISVLVLHSGHLFADDGFRLTVGANYSSYDKGGFESKLGYIATAGTDAVYLVATYEDPEYSILGQSMGPFAVLGAGLGGRVQLLNSPLFVTGKVMYYKPDLDPKGFVQDEVVIEILRANHITEPWHSPVNVFGQRTFESTDLQYSDTIGGSVGLEYEVTDRAKITLDFTFRTFVEKLSAWNGPREERGRACDCTWDEKNNLDMNSLQMGLHVVF